MVSRVSLGLLWLAMAVLKEKKPVKCTHNINTVFPTEKHNNILKTQEQGFVSHSYIVMISIP